MNARGALDTDGSWERVSAGVDGWETHLSAARDEHLLGFRVPRERGVDEGLVVDVLVILGALHEPVGDEQTAEGLGFDHLHGLELGLALVEHLLNLRRRRVDGGRLGEDGRAGEFVANGDGGAGRTL